MELRGNFSNLPWRSMAGMKDKLIHDYIDVDLNIVCTSYKEDTVVLLIEIEKIHKKITH